ncbi:hypothetical protein FVA95_26395 [Pseudonocardia sp. EV170527-09]|uniref:VOC family protein n=1 Tax=Pseudonocardia sp. EV170527-09 TaxID=2603411 RepID=UPI0011F3AE94|nr:VOC family protein [Pseudonocardia sp. EV170527-09]KAA1014612.1 hypothetical protein FVA95_26395 [Pseudonocardia sp. EV170527-09]
MKLDHVTIAANDVGRLVRFYTAFADLEVSWSDDRKFAEVRGPGIVLGIIDELYLAASGGPKFVDQQNPRLARNKTITQWSVSDLDQSVSTAESSGGEVLVRPVLLPWGSRSAYVLDPEHNMLEMYQWV